MDEILKRDNSNIKGYFPQLVLFVVVYKVARSLESVDRILKCSIQMKANE